MRLLERVPHTALNTPCGIVYNFSVGPSTNCRSYRARTELVFKDEQSIIYLS